MAAGEEAETETEAEVYVDGDVWSRGWSDAMIADFRSVGCQCLKAGNRGTVSAKYRVG